MLVSEHGLRACWQMPSGDGRVEDSGWGGGFSGKGCLQAEGRSVEAPGLEKGYEGEAEPGGVRRA